jgi:DNA-binding MarR family transcriptional regulator
MPALPKAARRAPAPRPSSAVDRLLRERAGTCVCGNLRMAARLMTLHFDAALRPAGIEANQMAMLWVIHAGGALSSSAVAHGVGIDQSTASRNLTVLEARSLVRMAASPDDRRQRMVSLTAEGKRALLRAYPLWEKAQAEVQAMHADLADVSAVGRTLRRVTRRMQAAGRP